MKKIKVIYIVGAGHSGSTLLDRILETSDNSFSVGELMSICKYERLIEEGETDFWKFWKRILSKTGFPPFFEHKSFSGKLKFFIGPLFNISFNKFDNFQFYLEVLKQNKTKDIIIDSSKDINRLISLNKNKNIDLHIIHLVRDVRGFANSIIRRNNRVYKKPNILIIFLKWFLFNFLTSLYLKLYCNKSNCLRIGYDYFVKDVEEGIKLLNKKFGLNIPLDGYINKANNLKSFAIVGNGMRNREIKSIKQDDSWKSELTKSNIIILTILAYIPNKMWSFKNS
jgi:hypothetical protein